MLSDLHLGQVVFQLLESRNGGDLFPHFLQDTLTRMKGITVSRNMYDRVHAASKFAVIVPHRVTVSVGMKLPAATLRGRVLLAS